MTNEERLYDYGLIFWNEKTDDEICTTFKARNYFEAEKIAELAHKPGYVKGVITFINDIDKSYYNIPLCQVADP